MSSNTTAAERRYTDKADERLTPRTHTHTRSLTERRAERTASGRPQGVGRHSEQAATPPCSGSAACSSAQQLSVQPSPRAAPGQLRARPARRGCVSNERDAAPALPPPTCVRTAPRGPPPPLRRAPHSGRRSPRSVPRRPPRGFGSREGSLPRRFAAVRAPRCPALPHARPEALTAARCPARSAVPAGPGAVALRVAGIRHFAAARRRRRQLSADRRS